MNNILGQDKLVAQFNNFTIDTLPHSMIFTGPFGCGKHLFCNELANKFGLNIYNIESKISAIDLRQALEEINNAVQPTLCIIDSTLITEKLESCLLKFIEEPFAHIFIAIINTNIGNMLPTISNRCQTFTFSSYSVDTLKLFCNSTDSLIYNIATTPGKMQAWSTEPLYIMYLDTTTLLTKIKTTKLTNLLVGFINKFDFASEQGKYKLDVFIEILQYTILELVVNASIEETAHRLQQYELINKFYNDFHTSNLNKQQLFEHFLCELKRIN